MKIRVLVNPRAGAGRAGARAAAVARALDAAGADYDVAATTRPGEATDLAARARLEGVDILGVVGGDGTFNEVVQAYVDASGRAIPGPTLALVPAGTGGDFRRTFGLDTSPQRAAERLLRGTDRSIDLGILRLTRASGESVVRAFANIASFGVGGRIDHLVNDSPKWMGGRLAFALATMRSLAVYRNQPVTVEVDGSAWHEGRVVNVALANGQYFGGGMRVAPEADPSDGLLDVVVLGDLTPLEAAGSTPRLYRGTHLSSPKVRVTRGKRVVARPLRSPGPVLIDCDGEAPGQLPLEAWLEPGALRLRL